MNFLITLWLVFGAFPKQSAQIEPVRLESETASFQLTITGFGKIEGNVRIAMFNSEESYNKKEEPIYAIELPVNDTKVSWDVEALPKGEYAIAIYHDKNENGKLDTNMLGIPKERYGFSNDARGKFGPASWRDAHFSVIDDVYLHEVHIK